jgi:hypothetical protein
VPVTERAHVAKLRRALDSLRKPKSVPDPFKFQLADDPLGYDTTLLKIFAREKRSFIFR